MNIRKFYVATNHRRLQDRSPKRRNRDDRLLAVCPFTLVFPRRSLLLAVPRPSSSPRKHHENRVTHTTHLVPARLAPAPGPRARRAVGSSNPGLEWRSVAAGVHRVAAAVPADHGRVRVVGGGGEVGDLSGRSVIYIYIYISILIIDTS